LGHSYTTYGKGAEQQMKKILSATLIAGLFSGAAFAQTTVSSANIVGYIKTETKNGLQLMASPFGAASINDLGLTNGVGGISLGSADNIHVYIPGEGYKNYFYLGYVNDPKYNYKWVDSNFTIATNKISPVTGIWYRCRKVGGFKWTLNRPYLNN
jgi:hypothetical protein